MKTNTVFYWLLAVAAAGAAAMFSSCKQNGAKPYAISLELVARGFDHPTAFAVPPDGLNRLFITEQTAAIKIINSTGAVLPELFLDLSSRMVSL